MGFGKRFALGIAAMTTMLSAPAGAHSVEENRIRELDIMLMMTSLRCRTGPDDFRAEYGRFTARHRDRLDAASWSMQTDLVRRHGRTSAKRQLDRLSVQMANMYGQGHPFLDCGQLKQLGSDLAGSDVSALAAASRELLADGRGGSATYARR